MKLTLTPFVAALALLASTSNAAVFTVDTVLDERDAEPGNAICATLRGRCSLRAAVEEANAIPGGDMILLPPGSYAFTLGGLPEDESASGDLDVLDDLVIAGSGPRVSVVNASGLDRVFHVLGDISVTLSGLSLRQGMAPLGAGIRNGRFELISSLTLQRAEVAWNRGSALHGEGTITDEVLILESSLHSNEGNGIQIANGQANVILRFSSVSNNRGTGVVVDNTHTTILDSIIDGNEEAGVSVDADGDVVVERTSIATNGVGIHGTSLFSTAIVSDSTVSGNVADGIAATSEFFLRLLNSTVSGNGSAGVRASGRSFIDIAYSTIAFNESSGILVGRASNGLQVRLDTTVFASNGTTQALPDCHDEEDSDQAVVFSAGHNVIGDASGCMLTAQPGDLFGSASAPVDPLVSALGSHGGRTPTHLPLEGSPLVDGGRQSCELLSCPLSDQRGLPRPTDGNGDGVVAFDIGAVEVGTSDPGVPPSSGLAPVCGDGIDNDGDGLVDDLDPGCDGPEGSSEASSLVNGGFESPEIVVGSLPVTSGSWTGNASEVVGSQFSVRPRSGHRMLRFLYTGDVLEAAQSTSSQVRQIVEVSGLLASLEAGERAWADASAFFNRVEGDAQTDTEFRVILDAFSGDPASYPAERESWIRREEVSLSADLDPVTWEEGRAQFQIPDGTEFLVVHVLARENVVNDTSGIELDGHYVDDTSLIVRRIPEGQCRDGVDNDGDQLVDWPADPGCLDAFSPQEGESQSLARSCGLGFELSALAALLLVLKERRRPRCPR